MEEHELIEYIKNNFRADFETGRLWKKFGNECRETGFTNTGGLLQAYVNKSIKMMNVHIIIWCLYYGSMPSKGISHIDGNGKNNTISNLTYTKGELEKRKISNRSDPKIIDYIKDHFRADFNTGKLYKRNKSEKWTEVIGCEDRKGYLTTGVFKWHFYISHLIWILYYGEFPKGMLDHINHEIKQNDIANLRDVNNSQNSRNMKKTYKYKGVSYYRRDDNWHGQIMKDYKGIHLGYFDTELDAANAYNLAAINLFGEYAYLNDIINDLWMYPDKMNNILLKISG